MSVGRLAAWLYLAGYLTDVMDGLLARAFNVASEKGRRLDGFADVAFHAFVGVGLAVAALQVGAWWVVAVLLGLFVGTRLERRWVAPHTVLGKAIAGGYKVVVFSLLVLGAHATERSELILAGAVIAVTTYTYEGVVMRRELRRGALAVR